jgi:hypothetical protein
VIGDKGQAGYYFDPTAFSAPTTAAFGNTARNQFRAPSYWNVDMSIFRRFPFGGGNKHVRVPDRDLQPVQPPTVGNPRHRRDQQ